MHKAELIDAVINATALPRAHVDAVCGALLESIMNSTAAGDKVALPGFGTFDARTRAARDGRNPATGAPLQIPATRVVAFKAGTAYKQLVAAGPGHPDTATTPATISSSTPATTGTKATAAKPKAAKPQKPRAATKK